MTGLRWGILSTGAIAHTFTGDVLRAGRRVTAVGSRTQAAADAFATRHGIARAHGSYESLVADPEVDIIYIGTPHPLHHPHATLALEHGKHVLVEKAFTLTRAEAEDLRQLGERQGLLVMEAMWTRYLPHMVRIRELLAAGALGEVRAVMADHTQLITDDPAHRLNNLALGGGALLDLGIYPISFIWEVLGAPDTIQASARLGAGGADAEVATVMTHAGGAVSTSLSSARAQGPNRASVIGTQARIDIDAVWYAPTSFTVTRADGQVVERYESQVEGRGMQYEALAAERLVAAGALGSDIQPLQETIDIMGCLDDIRAQIGVRYPGEKEQHG